MPRISYNAEQAVEVPFTDFAPDADIATRGILLDMDGARSTIKGYEALPSLTPYGSAVPDTDPIIRGSTIATYQAGNVSRLIAGTAPHLWAWPLILSGPGSVPVPIPVGPPTEIDGGRNVPAAHWRFFQFGDDVIALGSDIPQRANGPFGVFADLPITTPGPPDMIDCRVGCSVAGAVLLFNDVNWFSSAFGTDDNFDFTNGIQTGASFGTLYDLPGHVVACAPFYRTAIAFKEQAMWAGSIVGPPDWWSWQLISDAVGTFSQECVVTLPDSIAFLGTDDFYITTGSVPIRIPNNMKEWFFDTADLNLLKLTQGWYDRSHSIIYWHAVSKNPPVPNLPDFFVSYNVRARRWAKGTVTVRSIPQPATCIGHIDPIWFDADSVPVEMTGPPQNMILATGWIGDPAALTQLLRVRAKYRQVPDTQRLVVYSVNQLGDIPAPAPPAVPVLGNDNWFNLRASNRYHQAWLSTSGPCEIMGLAYEGRTAGVR